MIPIALAAILGALIGSFLNVVIARVPAGESVIRPASRCPRCGRTILARDNISILSWLALRGRARCCGEPISARYPLIEGGTAIAFAGIAWWSATLASSGTGPLGGAGVLSTPGIVATATLFYLGAVSICLAMIDIDVKRLPYVIVLQAWAVVGVGLSLASLLAGERAAVVRLLIGAAGLWGLYRLLHAIYPAGMAYGDVRAAALVGGACAWVSMSALAVGAFSGFLFGSLGGVLAIAFSGAGLKSQIPFGPYMLAGMWTGMVAGPWIGSTYLALFS